MVNDIANAIEKLSNDVELTKRLGENAMITAQQFNQKNYYRRFKEIVFQGMREKK